MRVEGGGAASVTKVPPARPFFQTMAFAFPVSGNVLTIKARQTDPAPGKHKVEAPTFMVYCPLVGNNCTAVILPVCYKTGKKGAAGVDP